MRIKMEKEIDLLKESAIMNYKNKDFNRAINELDKIKTIDINYFEKNLKFYYLWSIYHTQIKIEKNLIESNYNKFQENVKYILHHTKKDDLLYNMTIMFVVEYLESKSNYKACDLNKWLDKINPDTLNSESLSFKSSDGKKVSLSSQMEKWYSIKTRTLEKAEEYKECIKYCDMALEKINDFHHNNDIWFQRTKALCLWKSGNSKNAMEILKKILNKKNEWFIQKEIGDILLETGKIEEAKRYYIDAALNNGPSEMKIKLFWNLADIFEKKNMIEEEKQHRIFVLGLRQVYGWKLSSIEGEFKKTIPEKLLNEFNEKKYIKALRKIWESEKWDSGNIIEGIIDNLLPNGQSGFISTKNKRYYFLTKEFKGKKEQLIPGLKVSFYLGEGFDKKKNIETKVAVNIKLI